MDTIDFDFYIGPDSGDLLPPPEGLFDFDSGLGFGLPPRYRTPRPPSEPIVPLSDSTLVSPRRANGGLGRERTPNVKVFNIHGFSGEHAWLSSSGRVIPWSSSRLSFSIPELFDDGVDNQRFEEVAKGLLDLIATELSGESEDYVIAFLACDIGGTVVKKALLQASESDLDKYQNIFQKTSILIFLATPHRASFNHPWQSILFKLVWKFYTGRVDVWSPEQIDRLSSLCQSITESFDRMRSLNKFRIVSYYQDEPVDDEYELLLPKFAATMGWPTEIGVRAHRHHNLVGDFYIPADQWRLRRHVEHAQIATRMDYKAWLDILREASPAIVPLDNTDGKLYPVFCEWLVESNVMVKRWALDTEPTVSELDGSASAVRGECRNLLKLSIVTGTDSGDCSGLHSSLVQVIRSKRLDSNLETDVFFGISACFAGGEPSTTSQILATLCLQLLESNPNLLKSLDTPIEDVDVAIQFPHSTSLESLLWKCLERLLGPDFPGRMYLMVYPPSDATLSQSFNKFYHKCLSWLSASEVSASFLFVRQVEECDPPGSVGSNYQMCIAVADADGLIEPLEKDIESQLALAALPPSTGTMHAGSVFPLLSSQPFDSFLLIDLATRHVLASPVASSMAKALLDSIPSTRRDVVRMGLMWLAYGTRPLSSREFAVALSGAIKEDYDSNRIDTEAEELLRIFAGCLRLRSGKLCAVLPGLIKLVTTEEKGDHSAWYMISEKTAHHNLADICMARIRILTTHSVRKRGTSSAPGSPEASQIDSSTTLPHQRDPLLMYAIDNWYNHAKKSPHPPRAGWVNEDFLLWLRIRLSTASLAASRFGTAKSGPDELAWDPSSLSAHTQQPFDSCLSAILAGKAQRAPGVHSVWSLIAMAAARNGDDRLAKELILRHGADDSETILAISKHGGQSLLHQVLPTKRLVFEKNLKALLLDAVRLGHTQLVDALLQELDSSDIRASQETKREILQEWALTGQLTIGPGDPCWKLVSPIDVLQHQDASGNTPLHIAAKHGHRDVVKTLLDAGVDINRNNNNGETALFLASKHGHRSIVHLLLQKGASRISDGSRFKLTALHAACAGGHYDITMVLLDSTERISDLDSEDKTPLHHALEKGHVHVAVALLGKMPELPEGERRVLDSHENPWASALEMAVDYNMLPIVTAFLKRGADPNLICTDGRTLVHHAVKFGYFDILLELMEHGCKLYEKPSDFFSSVTVLDSAATRGHHRILKLLLERSEPREYQHLVGSALTLSSRWGQTEAVRLLLPHYTGNDHNKLAFVAAGMGRVEIVTFFLDHGTNKNLKNSDDNGQTLLHIAAEKNHSGLARALLLRGVQLEIRDDDGRTPLLVAAREGSFAIVDMLVKAGAKVNSADNEGNTRDALLEKARAWEQERLALVKENEKLPSASHENMAAPDLTDGTSGAPPVPEPAVTPTAPADTETEAPNSAQCAVAKLNYVGWSAFTARRLNSESQSFAIDVLKGEPVVGFDYTTFWRSRNAKKSGGPSKAAEAKLAPASAKPDAKQKQPLVPERIRIHSQSILKILEIISGETLSESGDPIVMIRPYKFLIYHEELIRLKFGELKDKFGGDSSTASGNSAPEPAATDPKAEPEDSEKEDYALTASLVAYEQLGCLVEFMDTEIQPKIWSLSRDAGGTRAQAVSFPDVWYLFKPGDEIVDQSNRQVYRVVGMTSVSHKVVSPWRNYYDKSEAKSDETPVTLHCVYIDFDGMHLGPASRLFEIARFDGERAVRSLEVYPLWYAEDSHALRDALAARGRMFLDVVGIKHMHYNGLRLDVRDEIDSQVVVDFEEAFVARGNADWRPVVEQLIGQSRLPKIKNTECAAECCRAESIYKDDEVEEKRCQDYIGSLIPENPNRLPSVAIYPRLLQGTRSPDNALTDDELVIMTYRVFGFVLKSRKWAKLDLTYLSHIEPISVLSKSSGVAGAANAYGEARAKKAKPTFEQLVLPQGHKAMVLSLIAQYYRDKESGTADTEQMDIIQGKGKGLIILLHGAPGVGKTATAEGVAELFKKPLFQITCGDLGTTASDVEVVLDTNFALANRWGCILLLDEADVFLTARSPQDFKRNGLVAVFLRALESYAGILFLTTNRIEDFDEAFRSRVHISLHYPQLDQTSTLAVFRLNLQLIRERFHRKGRRLTIDEKGILLYAEEYWVNHEEGRWNGRQIRNGCLTALALAEFAAQGGSHEHIMDADAEVKLQVKELDVVSRAYLDFNSYHAKLLGNDSGRRGANAPRIRALKTGGKTDLEESGNAFMMPVAPHTPSWSRGAIALTQSGTSLAVSSAYPHALPAPANTPPDPANYAPAPHMYYHPQPSTMQGFPLQNTTSNLTDMGMHLGQQPPWPGSTPSRPVPGPWQGQPPAAGQAAGQSHIYGQGQRQS